MEPSSNSGAVTPIRMPSPRTTASLTASPLASPTASPLRDSPLRSNMPEEKKHGHGPLGIVGRHTHVGMDPVDYYLAHVDKPGVRKTVLLYKLYADVTCSNMCKQIKQTIYGFIVDELIEKLWRMITHDAMLGNDFTRKYTFLRQIYHDGYYCFTSANLCAIQQLNRGINLRRLSTPVLNTIKSLF